MKGRIVIVAYKPKKGKEKDLRQLMTEHLSILRTQDLVTDRKSIIMESEEGTIIEVFEWKSKSAMDQAHTNPVILEMWGRYAESCDYIPLCQVNEAKQVFSEFSPLN